MQTKQVLLLLLLCASCRQAAEPTIAPEPPIHHTADGFRNPYAEHPKRGPLAYYRMRFFGEDTFADYAGQGHRVPQQPADLQSIHNPGAQPQLTWIGHATLLLQYRGLNLLTDPIFSERASPLSFIGPQRVLPPALEIAQLPTIDYILISHNHYDHLDLATVKALGDRPLWLVPLKLKGWLVENGISAERVIELDWWQQQSFNELTVTATPAQHWSKRSLWNTNRTLWAAWHLQFPDFSCWFAGDTGYNRVQFKEIGKRFGPIDLALLPIGGYGPRWFMKTSHIDPREAVTIHREIKAKNSVGIHWGTFPLTSEEIDEPPQELAEAIQRQKIPPATFRIMAIGETRTFSSRP